LRSFSVDNGALKKEAPSHAPDYRTVILEMLLSLHIQAPPSLENLTVGQHLANMKWKGNGKESILLGKNVEAAFAYGKHHSLCLAHGRRPITPVR